MSKLKGRLFLLPSPIDEQGMASIPPEAIRILHSLDYFIVERARTSRRYISQTRPARPIDILHIEEIPENMTDQKFIDAQLAPLLEGHNMGLLSEAGLPAIADPGNVYVATAHRLGIPVVPVSGPSSLMMALMASGLEGQRSNEEQTVTMPRRSGSRRLIATGRCWIWRGKCWMRSGCFVLRQGWEERMDLY
jgi:16S rRNA (cytidine1402-2'-O)-methyltransferase